MKIAIGADHNGYELKEAVKVHVEQLGHEVEDFGCHQCAETDYPDVANLWYGDWRSNHR